MSNQAELRRLARVVVQNRTSGVTTLNHTGALQLPVGTTAQRPASPQSFQTRYNTDTDQYETFVAGVWMSFTKKTNPEPADAVFVPAAVSGSGTSGSPYVVTTVNVTSDLRATVSTLTLSNLQPYEEVVFTDLANTTNGARFTFTNKVANAAGVLVTQIQFLDSTSLVGTNFTGQIRVGLPGVFINIPVSITAVALTNYTRISEGASGTYTSAAASNVLVSLAETSSGRMYTTDDGITIVQRESVTPGLTRHKYFPSVQGQEQFVGVGSGGRIFLSSSGVVWNDSVNNATTTALNSIAYRPSTNTFVAAGAGAGIVITAPGPIAVVGTPSTWTARGIGTAQVIADVELSPNGTAFVAVGNTNVIRRSTDSGVTWVSVFPGGGPSGNILSVTSSTTGIMVAVGNDGNVFTSTDQGATWTFQTIVDNPDLDKVVWTGSFFIASSSLSQLVYVSVDGSDWVLQTIRADAAIISSATLRGTNFTVGGSGEIKRNAGFNVWHTSAGYQYTGNYLNKTLFIGMSGGTVISSENGGAFKFGGPPTEEYVTGVAFNGTTYVVTSRTLATTSTSIYRANNLFATFALSTHPITTRLLNDVIWTGSYFVAVGNTGYIVTSPDGITWTQGDVGGVSQNLLAVATNGTQVVVVGGGTGVATILTNTNAGILAGTAWTTRTSPVAQRINDIANVGNAFVAVGDAGLIITSTDSINYTSRTGNLGSVSYLGVGSNGATTIATTSGGRITVSGNLSTWAERVVAPATTGALEWVVWDGTKFVVGGAPGLRVISST